VEVCSTSVVMSDVDDILCLIKFPFIKKKEINLFNLWVIICLIGKTS